MPRKRLGHKAVLKLGTTILGCVQNFTPPEKSREEIDVTCLGDPIMDYLDSDPPDQGTLKFTVVWEPGDTNSQLIDTLFDDADIEDRNGSWSILWQNFTPLVTDAFTARVMKITPAQVEQKNVIARTVELRLTSVVTRTIAP